MNLVFSYNSLCSENLTERSRNESDAEYTQKGLFMSIDSMHRMDSEHIHVLDSCGYKNVVRFCTGAIDSHRNEQDLPKKPLWFHSKKTTWTIVK